MKTDCWNFLFLGLNILAILLAACALRKSWRDNKKLNIRLNADKQQIKKIVDENNLEIKRSREDIQLLYRINKNFDFTEQYKKLFVNNNNAN